MKSKTKQQVILSTRENELYEGFVNIEIHK